MRLTRQSRVITALFALLSVLFMQLAVAAYACPSLTEGQTVPFVEAPVQAMDHEGMVGCEGQVDIEQPSLCHAHSQFGDQSLDKPELPNPAPSIAMVVMPAIKANLPSYPPAADLAEASGLRRSSAPALSIQHCCFRI